jgi:hypothetical protein
MFKPHRMRGKGFTTNRERRETMLQPEIVPPELAAILIPRPDDGRDPFFMDAARDLLAGLMTASFVDRGEFCLLDLRNAMRTKEGLRKILESNRIHH